MDKIPLISNPFLWCYTHPMSLWVQRARAHQVKRKRLCGVTVESLQHPTVIARRSVVSVAHLGQEITQGFLCGFRERQKFCISNVTLKMGLK